MSLPQVLLEPNPQNSSFLFPTSGQAFLRSGFGPPDQFAAQTHIAFDLGAYRTDHSQRDALSITVYSAGRTLLPDSGLYTYEIGEEFAWFEGTAAHNTVVVDGVDQAVEGPIYPGLTASQEGWAYQSGQHQLYDGVTHRRSILLLDRDVILVLDRMNSNDPHSYSQLWHFAPDLTLTTQGSETIAHDQAGRPVVRLIQGLSDSSYPNLVESWHSNHYEVRVRNEAVEYTELAVDRDYITSPNRTKGRRASYMDSSNRRGEDRDCSLHRGPTKPGVDLANG